MMAARVQPGTQSHADAAQAARRASASGCAKRQWRPPAPHLRNTHCPPHAGRTLLAAAQEAQPKAAAGPHRGVDASYAHADLAC